MSILVSLCHLKFEIDLSADMDDTKSKYTLTQFCRCTAVAQFMSDLVKWIFRGQ